MGTRRSRRPCGARFLDSVFSCRRLRLASISRSGVAMAYPHLFEPIDVGPITIPNRIVRSAHGTHAHRRAADRLPRGAGRGGVGMSTLEATGVHANAPSVTPLYSDDVHPDLPGADGAHPPVRDEDAPADLPPRARPPGRRRPPTQLSSSAIPNPMVGGIPMEMDHVDDRRDGRRPSPPRPGAAATAGSTASTCTLRAAT